MNTLLKKEKILYASVINKETDKDSVSAFFDYATFLSDEGISLIAHINQEIKERQTEEKKIEDLYIDIIENIKKDTFELKELAEKLKLDKDHILIERFGCLHEFLEGRTFSIGMEALESPSMDLNDVLRRFDKLGYLKEVSKYSILSNSSTPFIKDAVAFKNKKKYYLLKSAFKKKHSRTVVGALVNVMTILGNINRPESEITYTRNAFIGDVEKIHNSIILKYIDNDPEESNPHGNQIFFMKGEEIHHYEIGLLTYDLVSTQEPKYITMFKNIIRYMPLNKKRIRVINFEKLMPKNQRVGDVYRDNLGSIAKSFHNFLKQNSVHNIHPGTKKPVIKVTRDYINFYNLI